MSNQSKLYKQLISSNEKVANTIKEFRKNPNKRKFNKKRK